MDSRADRLEAMNLYRSLTNPTIIRADIVGKTLKLIIVSKRFEGMTIKERIDFLKNAFFQSDLSTRYLVSFEAYTPKETSDGGFGEGDFGEEDSSSGGSGRIAAKPAEI